MKIIGHSQHPRIHCTGRVKYSSTFRPPGEKEEEEVWLYSGITDQRRPLTLKFSTIFLLEFATKSVNEGDRHTHK